MQEGEGEREQKISHMHQAWDIEMLIFVMKQKFSDTKFPHVMYYLLLIIGGVAVSGTG